MKVKRLPEDFIVDEQSEVSPASDGGYGLYRLRKRSCGTLEAVEQIQRRWKLTRRQLSWGGLKDKHAVTSQHLTIQRGPSRGLQMGDVSLEFLGRLDRPFQAGDISGNRFSIVLRALNDSELQQALEALPEVQRCGLPNYFDDQRFGSLGESGEFIAGPWIRGDYERALWLAFAESNAFDRAAEKREKALLRDHWGDWPECKRLLSRSHRRSIITFLADRPGDFRGAWSRVNQDLRSLYLAAFQSFLWNEILAALLMEFCEPNQLAEVRLKTGPLPFPRDIDERLSSLRNVQLPLPSARIHPDSIGDESVRRLIERTLAARGWELRQLRVKHSRDSFFSKGWRRAVIPVNTLRWEHGPDDLHEERHLLRLEFDLPRGSYATILIKRITDAAHAADAFN
jgi:tRNA pseudouridine13 synthase